MPDSNEVAVGFFQLFARYVNIDPQNRAVILERFHQDLSTADASSFNISTYIGVNSIQKGFFLTVRNERDRQ
jgi:hypothetical protein